MRQGIPVFILFATLVAGAEQEPLTLAEAVRLALERYPDTLKARAAADGLKGRVREVRAQALPDISINAGGMRLRDPSLLNASGLDKFPEELRNALVPSGVNLFDYYVSVKQPLFTAGKVGTALRLASVESEAAQVDVDRAGHDLSLAVSKAFVGLQWTERYRELVAETQEQRKLHARMARTRLENGVATEVDALRSEVAVANGAPDLVRAANDIRQARALLNFYVVRPIEFPTRAAGELGEAAWDEWDLEALTKEAFRRRPDLHRLRLAERSAEVQLQLARAENRMRADFSGAYGVASRLPENLMDSKFARWSMAVTFTLPVFDGFKRSGLVWQASAAERTARLEREKTEQQISLNLRQSLDEMTAARETIAAARANIRQAEKVLAMTQSNYKFGAATTLDIVDAQTALSLARTNLLRGLHDYSVARATLRWGIGRTPWE